MNKDTGEVIFLRTPYNYDTDAVSVETGTNCGDRTRTQRQYKDEVDINTIVERFGVTGTQPPKGNFPTEQDFTNTMDFQSSMNVIVQARETFMELPAQARKRFQNDPQQFMEFIYNPDNFHEAEKLGLLTVVKPEPPKPAPPAEKETDTK